MYKIKKIKSQRDSFPKNQAQKEYKLPPPGLTVFCGSTGSGKTNVICNLLQKEMLGKQYDIIFMFCLSPCLMIQDNAMKGKLKDEHIFSDGDPSKLQVIIDKLKANVKKNGFKKAPHCLFILDDMAQDSKFFNSPGVRELAFAGTQFKCSTWVTTQSYVMIPRSVRINCHALIMIHGMKESEFIRFAAEHQSPFMTKKAFIDMVKHATKEQFDFLFVNCTNPNKKKAFSHTFEHPLLIQ